jgi:hypothetical protein
MLSQPLSKICLYEIYLQVMKRASATARWIRTATEADSTAIPAQAFSVPGPFRDSKSLRNRAASDLSRLQADFARCLALAAWAIAKPLRLVAFGVPMHAGIDDALLACLRNAGWPFAGLDDARLDECWDSRVEFAAASADEPAQYREGPSYHERLRLELLLDAWERISLRLVSDVSALDALAARLAEASAVFAAPLAVPIDALRRAAAERQAEALCEDLLEAQLRVDLAAFPAEHIGRLAIQCALDGAVDAGKAVQRYGTEAMRERVREFGERRPPTQARAIADFVLARLRRELWAPITPCR